jgi:hypothetical protein
LACSPLRGDFQSKKPPSTLAATLPQAIAPAHGEPFHAAPRLLGEPLAQDMGAAIEIDQPAVLLAEHQPELLAARAEAHGD